MHTKSLVGNTARALNGGTTAGSETVLDGGTPWQDGRNTPLARGGTLVSNGISRRL